MIDLFVSDHCPYCKKVMDFAQECGIKFNKINIENEDNVLRLLTIGGKEQVPFLYDPSDDTRMYESEDIIQYLKDLYQV